MESEESAIDRSDTIQHCELVHCTGLSYVIAHRVLADGLQAYRPAVLALVAAHSLCDEHGFGFGCTVAAQRAAPA